MKSRKRRSDSITVQGEMYRSAGEVIEPPAHVSLRPGDRPFWDSIVRARARDTWNEADLEQAANLARCKADIERIQAEIHIEGDVLENAKGTQIVNPKHALLETLSRRAVALSRTLHVHAEATQGRSRDTGQRTQAQKSAEESRRQAESSSLIAPPINPH